MLPFSRADVLQRLGAEQDSAVTICLKVDADIVLLGLVMQMLDTGGNARNGNFLGVQIGFMTCSFKNRYYEQVDHSTIHFSYLQEP